MSVPKKKSFEDVLTFWKNKDKLTKQQPFTQEKKIKSESKKRKSDKCNQVRPKPPNLFDNKRERRTELRKRCTAQGININKKCTVPNRKVLVCHDSKRK